MLFQYVARHMWCLKCQLVIWLPGAKRCYWLGSHAAKSSACEKMFFPAKFPTWSWLSTAWKLTEFGAQNVVQMSGFFTGWCLFTSWAPKHWTPQGPDQCIIPRPGLLFATGAYTNNFANIGKMKYDSANHVLYDLAFAPRKLLIKP